MTIALLDADIIAFRCAASAEKDDRDIALIRTDKLIQEILADTGATSYKAYLTSKQREDNFRRKLDSSYKANRDTKEPPQHLQACKEFLVTNWKAETTQGYEADDALGMEQKMEGTVICSIDKDLLQVPGHHYNFVKKETRLVTEDQGLKSFYMQTLIGDRSDNIIGVQGIGPVKASKLLDPLLPEQYYLACKEAYGDTKRFHLNCKLLWIWRTPNGVWEPPK